MTLVGWSQIALVLALVVACSIPLSVFVARVYAGQRTFLSPVLGPVERGFYRLAGVDPAREQDWYAYAIAMVVFSVAGFLSLYALQRLQNLLPLNPRGFDGVPPDLAFNTSDSFITNTNWQNYSGETTMSHLTQMLGLTVHNFLSAATGLAMAFALVRGFVRSSATTVGNFSVREPQRLVQPSRNLGAPFDPGRLRSRLRPRRRRHAPRTCDPGGDGSFSRRRRHRRLFVGDRRQYNSDGARREPVGSAISRARKSATVRRCPVLYATATSGTSTASVNAMNNSITPVGGMVPMSTFSRAASGRAASARGCSGFLVVAIIAVFVAGLMVGRTPEYLGKKIETREMKLAMLAVLIYPLSVLGFTGASVLLESALDSMNNSGPHGLSEVIYAYASANENNGSAFAGLNGNTLWFNTTLGLAMLLGRFAYVIPVLALAGSLAAKKKIPASAGTFPTDGPLFVGLLVGVIVILYLLQYFPALSLGPIVEHYLMLDGKTF